MSSWREQYAQALQVRDQKEKAGYSRIDSQIIQAFTTLLERIVALEAEKVTSTTTTNDTGPRQADLQKTNDGIAQLKSNLAEALRSKGQLYSRVKGAEAELEKLRAKIASDTKAVHDLTRERIFLSQKLKDRDEELRGKTKLLDDVHDEVISLNLQLNISEQKVKVLKTENKDLIDRWMARKSREAEDMNRSLQDGI